MSFNDESAKAVADGEIGVGFLIDANGQSFWSVGTWDGFEPSYVLQEFSSSQQALQSVFCQKLSECTQGDFCR